MLCVLLSLHSSSGDATNWVARMGRVVCMKSLLSWVVCASNVYVMCQIFSLQYLGQGSPREHWNWLLCVQDLSASWNEKFQVSGYPFLVNDVEPVERLSWAYLLCCKPILHCWCHHLEQLIIMHLPALHVRHLSLDIQLFTIQRFAIFLI